MSCIEQIENFIDAKIEFAMSVITKSTDRSQLGRNVQVTRNDLDRCLLESKK